MNKYFEHLIHDFEIPLTNPVLVFSLILFIILLAPILLKKFNIPGIIGLIISGVIIGPHGFNILEKNSAIELFSTIGLLYIMFIAGLELDMNQFRINRNKSLVFGVSTFVIPILIGFPVCYFLLGYELNASLLIASMFATHTMVAYPIVSKLGISKNQAVAVTVGGTILTDTAVLIILAVIMGNSAGSLSRDFWVKLGVSLAIFSAIMFWIIPRIAAWFFQKLESEKHAHYIFVLAVVFFSAFLAEAAGVESIIGAFVAGLALNRLIPHSSALMNRIEFIGNSLFIPFFLISVGMLVDVSVILNGPAALLIAATLTLVALLGKWLAALITQLIFRYSRDQRMLIFGLSSSHAAATLAIILVGFNAGILDENILNGTIILILITCVVASFVTEKASKAIVIKDESDEDLIITNPQFSNEHILLPIANASNMEKLLEFAFLIKDKKSVNPISILSVVPNNDGSELNIMKSRSKLDEYVRQASATEVKVNVISTIDHNAASGIARTSREIMADVIIIGWPRKAGFFDKFIGEKVESIINNVDKNLFVCNLENSLVKHKRIVVVSPPLAELEFGFDLWLQKICKLAQELSIPVVHYGDAKTQESIRNQIKKRNLTVAFSFVNFTEWEDFLILSREIQTDDLLVMVSARKSAVSYISALENIPMKLEKHFEANNKLMIYPQQNIHHLINEAFEDISSGPLTKGIEAIEQLGKGIGSIFKKSNKNE